MKRILVSSILMASTLYDARAQEVPVTRQDDTVDNYFGTQVPDPYRWLEDDASDETAQWVITQNKATDNYLSKLPDRKRLLERIKEVADYDLLGLPTRKKNGKWYYFLHDGKHNQRVLYEMDTPRRNRMCSWIPTP